jgi:hypothetical protein
LLSFPTSPQNLIFPGIFICGKSESIILYYALKNPLRGIDRSHSCCVLITCKKKKRWRRTQETSRGGTILIVAKVSWVYTCVQTRQIVHIKSVEFTIYQLYFNTALLKINKYYIYLIANKWHLIFVISCLINKVVHFLICWLTVHLQFIFWKWLAHILCLFLPFSYSF